MRLTLLAAVLLASTAYAKGQGIDFTKHLVGVNGDNLFQAGEDCNGGLIPGKTCSKLDLTLGDVAIGALMSMLDQDKNEDPKKRFERDQLARKVYKKTNAVLSSEEISLIKDRIGRTYGVNLVGASWLLLDPSLGGKDAK